MYKSAAIWGVRFLIIGAWLGVATAFVIPDRFAIELAIPMRGCLGGLVGFILGGIGGVLTQLLRGDGETDSVLHGVFLFALFLSLLVGVIVASV